MNQPNKAHLRGKKCRKQKKDYQGFIIEYKDSPTGRAFIGCAKLPLMPNSNGIGFMGVKIQTEEKDLMQCCECGKWFIGVCWHVREHGLTAASYKQKFGLNKLTGLVSDKMSNSLSRANSGILKRIRTKNSHLAVLKKPGCNPTMQLRNKFGTCPDQLRHEVITYIHRFKKIPNCWSIKDGFNKEPTIRAYYGTFNKALEEWGLPTRKNIGKGTVYKFPDSTEHFLRHCCEFDNYEELYEIMLDKCPILQKTLFYNPKPTKENPRIIEEGKNIIPEQISLIPE